MMKLRPMSPADLSVVSGLGIRSKASWGYDSAMMEVFSAELTLSESEFSRLDDAVVALDPDGEIIGYYTLLLSGSPISAELEHLFVDPEHQLKGVGSNLLLAAIGSAKNSGATSLRVISDPFAAGFYEKHGAVRVGEHHSADIPGRKIPILQFDLFESVNPRLEEPH